MISWQRYLGRLEPTGIAKSHHAIALTFGEGEERGSEVASELAKGRERKREWGEKAFDFYKGK